ncbi:OB-fold nucleic acid binding domain-containing protein [Deinococcus malanensis]|uniref:OB-fold nucleic acid binding domain-containing protein n=1 Tax=Deinococcus malanensis TaxID=1706855 RepID=UPI0036374C28
MPGARWAEARQHGLGGRGHRGEAAATDSQGFAFYVLEDRTARVQAIISPDLWEAHRVLLRDARALIVQGQVTRLERAVTIKVQRLSELPLRHAESTVEAAD